MIPDLLSKLTGALAKPVRTECQVVYLMVELRKLMDRQDATQHYPVLRLFCDWTVHTNIDRNRAAEPLIREFDNAVESVRGGNGMPLQFLDFLSLSHFRQQFRKFLDANGLPKAVVDDGDAWTRFLDLYSDVVSDCPISYTRSQLPFKLISSLTLTKDLPENSYVLTLLDSQKPFDLWMNWRIELTDGSVENWPFYN